MNRDELLGRFRKEEDAKIDKSKESARIKSDIERFIANGGKIQSVKIGEVSEQTRKFTISNKLDELL